MSCDNSMSLAMHTETSRHVCSSQNRCGVPASIRAASRGSRTRGSRTRSGSRISTPASSRSGSVACRRRPSREVELRAPISLGLFDSPRGSEYAFSPTTEVIGVNDCAVGFVHDLLDDAVIDFAEDLVHDLDDACQSPLNNMAPSHAVTVHSVNEPMITEFEEEGDDTWAAATVITEVAAQQALHNIVEKSSTQETESTTDSVTQDDYEEVYTWEGAEAVAHGETSEIEATVYAEMAASIAKTALDKGCEPEKAAAMVEAPEPQQLIQDNAQSKDEVAHDFVCNLLDDAIGDAALTAWQAADGADSCVDEPPPVNWIPSVAPIEAEEINVEELRIRARQTLLKAAREGKLEQCIASKAKVNDSQCTADSLKATLAKHMCDAARTGHLKDIFAKINQSKETAQNDEFKAQKDEFEESARKTLAKHMLDAARSGHLKNVFAKIGQKRETAQRDEFEADASSLEVLEPNEVDEAAISEDEAKELQRQARKTLLEGFESGRLEDAFVKAKQATEMEHAKNRAKQTLTEAAQSGELQAALSKIVKARELAEVRRLARETLFGATTSGELDKVCAKVDEEEKFASLKKKAQGALAKGLQSLFSEKAVVQKQPSIEEIEATPKTSQISAGSSTPVSSKMKRRIIGGVSRTSKQGDELTTMASPSAGHSRRSRHSKKEQKEDKPDFRQAGDSDLDFSSWEKAFGAPAFDRPTSSKTSARLRKAVSMSALAMDLGADVPLAPELTPQPPAYVSPNMLSSSVAPSSFGQMSFTHIPLQKSRCSSATSLRVSKSKASGLLPSLPSKHSSTESIEWSRGISKSSLKWSTIDFRGTGSAF